MITGKFLRIPGIEARPMDRSVVLVKPEKQLYFALNRVGTRIWSLLEQPRTIEGVTRILTGEFDVDESECRRHTEQFLTLLISKELVTRVDE